MNNARVRTNPTMLALAIAGFVAGAAQAQTADGIQEVIVTAQRTAAPESKTPVAMSVLTAARLEQEGIDSPADIAARLPNTWIETGNDGIRITIRGVTSSDNTEKGDPSAAFMQDGVYIARPQGQTSSFFDVDRIEVLRGPQGTLYGRNTTAGVVNVISKAPVGHVEAAASVEVGSYANRKVDAMVNLPVNEVLALRAAVTYNERDPYLRNGQGTPYDLGLNRDDRAARLSAKLDFNRDASLLLRYEHSRDDARNNGIVPDTNFFNGVSAGKPVWYDSPASQQLTNAFKPFNTRPEQGYNHKTMSALTAEGNWKLGALTLSYLGSHRDFDQNYLYNYYYRVAPTVAIGVHQSFWADYRQDSHELRLATNGSGPLSAQAGLYWFREETSDQYSFRDLQLIGLTPYYVFDVSPNVARSKAVFGQLGYRLSERLRATAGARRTHDEKARDGSIGYQQGPVFNPATDLRALNAGEIRTNKTTWRLGAEYDLDPATMLYATVSTGYKAGGFNDGCVAGDSWNGIRCPGNSAIPAARLVYQPETVRAYEAGLKTRFWHNRASLNAAAFHYDYKNLQLSAGIILDGKPLFETSNAGEASVNGLEVDGQVLAGAADRFHYGLTLLDAHYVSYLPDGVHSWAGDKLNRTPTRTATLGWEHRFGLQAGAVVAGVSTRFSSRYMLGVPTQQLRYWIPGYRETDLRLGWEPLGARWSLLARVRNLENHVRPTNIDSFGMAVPSAPRTADLRLDVRF